MAPIYKIYYSSPVGPQNKMWCPDCLLVEPTLSKIFNITFPPSTTTTSPITTSHSTTQNSVPADTAKPSAEIVYTGDRATWKSPTNIYRQAPLNVNSVPTVLKFSDEDGEIIIARIQDDDILNEGLMRAFLTAGE